MADVIQFYVFPMDAVSKTMSLAGNIAENRTELSCPAYPTWEIATGSLASEVADYKKTEFLCKKIWAFSSMYWTKFLTSCLP